MSHIPEREGSVMDKLLRNEPVQVGAKATRDKLRAAALEVLAEVGRDRLTTAMVAVRAGVSVGTFYRYYTDRVAVIEDVQPIEGGLDGLIAAYYEGMAAAGLAVAS